MKPRQHSTFRRSSSLLITVSFAMSLTAAHAADQTWIPAGPTNNWSTTDLNWDAGVAWTQANNAIFGGTGETVTLTEGIAAGGLTFNSSGYTIAGNTLTLAAGAAINTGTNNATIASLIAGPSFSKSGAGELVLTGASNYAGAVTINAGTLKVAVGSLSGAAVNLSTSGAKLNLDYQTTYAWAPNSAVALNGANANNVIDGNSGTRWSSTTQYCWIYADLGSTQSLGQFAINYEYACSSAFKVQVSNDASTWTDATGVLNAGGDGLKIYNLNSGTSGRYVRVESTQGRLPGWGTSIWEMSALGAPVSAGTYSLGSLSGVAGTTVDMAQIANTLKVGSANTDTTFAGTITGGSAATLEKVGTGTLILSGANSYSGNTSVTAGTLVLQQQHTGSTITTASGAITEWQQTAAIGYWYGLTGTITFAGTGRLNKTGAFDMYGDQGEGGNAIRVSQSAGALFDMQAGRFDQGSGGGFKSTNRGSLNVAADATIGLWASSATVDALTGSGTIVNGYGSSTVTLTVGAADHTSSVDNPFFTGTSATFSGVLANGTAGTLALTKTGTGTQTLSGTMTYTGATTINAGTLELLKPVSFTSNIVMGAANSPTLRLGSTLVADSWTLAQQISGGSANAKIEKTGLGTVILTPSAGSTFVGTSSGALTVTGGKLYLNAAFTTAPAVSVAAGALFGGTVTAGNVTVANTSTLEGGMSSSGTLTAANVTLGSLATDTAILKGALSATAGYKALAVTNLTLNGGDNTVTLDAAGAGLSSGSYYDLLESTNVITAPNASGGLAVNVFKSNSRAYTPNVDVTGKKVQLYYDATASVYWTGAVSSAWNPTATNWKLSGNNAATEFLANDVVFFHDGPASSTVDISNGNVSTSSTTFDNTTATAYTLQGTNGIAAGSLNKSGTGILTITNANSFGGGTTLSGGTLNINNAAALGSGTLVINGGTLDNTSAAAITLSTNNVQTWGGSMVFTGTKDLNLGSGAVAMTASHNVGVTAGTLTVGGVISGSAGSLTKSGNGTLVLGGANNYTGATLITAGTLEVTRPMFYTTTSSGYDVAAGAAFTFKMPAAGYDMYLSSPLTGTGTVNLINNGWSMLLDADNSAFAGTVTTSGSSNLFLTRASATSANTAYIIETTGWAAGWGGLCTQSIASGSTIHLGSLSGTNPATKIASGSGGSGTINWSVGALGTDTTFAGYFGDYYMVTALTKVGSGTLTITGANTYTGNTSVNGGTLVLRQQKAGGTITTASGAITEWQQTADMGWAFGLQPGSVTFAGAGRVNKTGAADSYMYGDHASGGTFRVNQSAGAVFDMQAGRFDQGGGGGGFIGTNLGSLNVASGATIGLWGSNATVDALTGAGTLVNGENNAKTLTVGAANHTSSVDNPYFTGTSATFSGTLANGTAGTLALTKTGSGTQILTGTNTYSGGTTLSNGTLLVNNTIGSGTGSGAIIVNGGTLGGSGSIAGTVTLNGGTLAPGASIESLTTGALTMNTGTTFAYEMNSTVGSYAADLLVVTGAVTLNGTVQLGLTDVLGEAATQFAGGTILTLINYASTLSGGFFYGTALGEGDTFTAGLNTWKINYGAATGGLNFTGVLNPGSLFINLTAIPEPGSWLALGCLVGSGMLLRSRRRH